MMRSDSIVEEMRTHGREFAAKHGNDIRRICEALRELETVSGRRSCAANRSVWSERLRANQSLQPTANPLRGLSAAELGRYAS